MDQGCAFGNRPVVMMYDGDRMDTVELQVKQDLHFVIVDLQAQKDTMEILNRLNRCSFNGWMSESSSWQPCNRKRE